MGEIFINDERVRNMVKVSVQYFKVQYWHMPAVTKEHENFNLGSC